MSRAIRLRIQETRYPHWGIHSGVVQFIHHLDPQQFRVTMRYAADNDSGLPIPLPSMRNWLRKRVQRNGMAWYKLSDLAGELRALGAIAARQADIVHFLDGEHGVQYLPRWKELFSPLTKIIASFHQPPSLLPELVNSDVLRKLDCAVLISSSQYGYFAQHMPDEKIVTILHGINTDFFRPAATRADRDRLRCLTVGYWLRDWEAIAGAVRRLGDRKDIEFHVVAIADTGLEDMPQVHVHKGLSDTDLAALEASCDVLLLPFRDVTASNSLLEGMACGLPVISTDLPSLHAYTNEDCAILVGLGDADALADAIMALKEAPARRRVMGEAARARALELAWPRIAHDYATLYRQLAQS